jgi:HlyD family secretion protein
MSDQKTNTILLDGTQRLKKTPSESDGFRRRLFHRQRLLFMDTLSNFQDKKGKHSMKTIAGILVAIALTGMVGRKIWQSVFAERPDFRTVEAARSDLFLGVTATGTVEPMEIIEVGAQIVGCIKKFGPDPDRPGKTIDYRSRVKKDVVLAQLDDLPHQAERDKARVHLQLTEAELSRYRAKARQVAKNLDRATQLRETDSAEAYDSAVAESEMSKAELAMAEARVEQAKIAVKQAEINLGYTTITSPIDGVVIDRCVNVGQTVVAGMNAPKLFLLAKDLSRMLVWAAVNEADIGQIKVGQKVTFKVDAYRDEVFTGKVSQIRLNASLNQNVVMYGVVVDVDNTEGKLLPYMTAKLQFTVASRSKVLCVPNQALRWQPTWEQISPSARENLNQPVADTTKPTKKNADTELRVDRGSPTVWVVADDGLVRPVDVKTGLSDGMMTEISDGAVEPGDAVVVHEVRKSQPDFVSSFISHVTSKDE